MMVFGPGGYRFTDFVRVGVPLNLLMLDRRRDPDPDDLAVLKMTLSDRER